MWDLKRVITFLLLIVLSAMPVLADAPTAEYVALPENQEIRIPIGEDYFVVNGVKQKTDTPAYLTDEGITMIPMRVVFNIFDSAIGNSITWNVEEKSAATDMYERVVKFTLEENYYVINGVSIPHKMGTPKLTNGVFYIPLRDFGDAFGFEISWEQETSTAIINKAQY